MTNVGLIYVDYNHTIYKYNGYYEGLKFNTFIKLGDLETVLVLYMEYRLVIIF